jgi:hypothetical protein
MTRLTEVEWFTLWRLAGRPHMLSYDMLWNLPEQGLIQRLVQSEQEARERRLGIIGSVYFVFDEDEEIRVGISAQTREYVIRCSAADEDSWTGSWSVARRRLRRCLRRWVECFGAPVTLGGMRFP